MIFSNKKEIKYIKISVGEPCIKVSKGLYYIDIDCSLDLYKECILPYSNFMRICDLLQIRVLFKKEEDSVYPLLEIDYALIKIRLYEYYNKKIITTLPDIQLILDFLNFIVSNKSSAIKIQNFNS